MSTLFIADIHLGGEHPEISRRFVEFLERQAPGCEALYILGDLFEVWIGDDAVQAEHRAALQALRRLTDQGVPVRIMHGNRDFLLGHGFEALSGCQLIDDPQVIDLYGTRTLVMHGDSLCSDDVDYQQLRRQLRDPAWQRQFLAASEARRLAIAKQYRDASRSRTREKTEAIMDVNPAAVVEAMRAYGVTQLIHGHTHRPAVHELEIDGRPARRIVLGDWYSQDSSLRCDASGCRLSNFAKD
ncbi:UDP-2,3-diacylglucosamine hydrolase [Candidatus Tenderia electrophaga]|jgi:UDP-2,3-diacylglucosamine hydrolase|uniref:UDP-2,3-diacylglucosamine hydrolase n=1 Tax=Candidatus Tenderia electrophaga TaxID=1748243 RepID=A0A0S2TBL4_9GAMM|nr:UDP-2,3-diacylglucosamine hydrolase [Candidatus Tenderia electrophaga]